jgi:hypothetical protein
MTTATGCQYHLSAAFACATHRQLIGNYAASYRATMHRHWQQEPALLAVMNKSNASVKRYQRISDQALLAIMLKANASGKRSGLTCVNSWNIINHRTFFTVPKTGGNEINYWVIQQIRSGIGGPLPGGNQPPIKTTGQLWPRYA